MLHAKTIAIVVGGFAGTTLARALDGKLPPGRKVRIFVEWTWGIFFPNDITHLRFQRSHELDESPGRHSWVPHPRSHGAPQRPWCSGVAAPVASSYKLVT